MANILIDKDVELTILSTENILAEKDGSPSPKAIPVRAKKIWTALQE